MAEGDQNLNAGDVGAWKSQLKGDLQGNEFFNQFPTVSEFGKWGVETAGKLKATEEKLNSALFIPGEKSTDEERAAFYGKLGRPEGPDKYELKRPALPEGMQYDEAGEKWFREQAHKLGLSNAQAAQIFEGYNARMDGIIKDIEAKRTKAAQEGLETLKKQWGGEFDANMNIVKRATDAFLGPEDKKFMDESGLGNHPVLVNLFVKIGKAMAEDKFVKGQVGGQKPAGTFDYPSMK